MDDPKYTLLQKIAKWFGINILCRIGIHKYDYIYADEEGDNHLRICFRCGKYTQAAKTAEMPEMEE